MNAGLAVTVQTPGNNTACGRVHISCTVDGRYEDGLVQGIASDESRGWLLAGGRFGGAQGFTPTEVRLEREQPFIMSATKSEADKVDNRIRLELLIWSF